MLPTCDPNILYAPELRRMVVVVINKANKEEYIFLEKFLRTKSKYKVK